MTTIDAAPALPQFVVHAHDVPPLHYDLMLEWGDVLATWETAQPPSREHGEQPVTPKDDHRREYLALEGPIAGGRGTTQIWDRGTYHARRSPAGAMFVELSGERCRGWFRLEQRDGAWRFMPVDDVPADADAVDIQVNHAARVAPPPAPAVPDRAPGRRPRAVRPEKAMRLSTKLLLVGSVLVFAGGVVYLSLRAHYRSRFRSQAYVEILTVYRDIGREKDQATALQMEADLTAKLQGHEIEVIGRVGAIEPITDREKVTHPGGKPVRLWVDVPNVVEPANADRKDVACVVAHAQLDEAAAPAEARGAVAPHEHRYSRGELVRITGTLVKFNVASNGSRASLEVHNATIVPMNPIEEHFYRGEARTLGPLLPLKGINDPYRDRRDAHGKVK